LIERWEARSGDLLSGSASDAIREVLMQAIVERGLPPGWRLSEERLAVLFGVSRTPVREALMQLCSSDLVRRDGRGVLRVELISAEKVMEVYAVRGALEGLSAYLAAQLSTPIGILELEHLNDRCVQAAQAADYAAMATHNLDFHMAIVKAARNETLSQFLTSIHNWVKRIPKTTLAYPGRAEKAIAEHQEIIEAIRLRDPERAEAVTRRHMRGAEKIRIMMLTQGGAPRSSRIRPLFQSDSGSDAP
jgi:DNA-binding GntR family transcriptional regulator